MANKPLKVGEKYLSIVVLNSIKLAAFKVDKKNPKEPDYKGNGVSVWINEKKDNSIPKGELLEI